MSIEFWIVIILWSVFGVIIWGWALDAQVFNKPRLQWYKVVILVILMGPLMAAIFLFYCLVCIPVAYFLDWLSS